MTNPLIRPDDRGPVSRRSFLRVAGLSAAALGGGGILAACGGAETPAASSASSATSAVASSAGEASASMSSSAAGGSMTMAPAGTYGDIKLQLSWVKNYEFAGEFFATEKGYYTEAGFSSVELVSGPVPSSAEELVATGEVQIGLSAPDATARYILDTGAPLKIIGSTYQKNPFCILSLQEGKPISTPADLVGKNIGVQAGTNQSIFEGFLKANGLTADQLTITPVQYDPAPLYENQVDGFMSYVTNEPFLAEAKGFTPVTLVFADNGLPLTAETFTVLQDTIDNDREMLKAFLWAEIKGWTDSIADPQGSAELSANKYGKDLNLDVENEVKQATAQNELIVSDDTKQNGIFTLTEELQGQIVEAIKLTGYETSAEELFDLSLLDEVYAAYPDLITG
ncbi:ABC transporter substrate-binding protein [Nakamurella deserti]|uniref:ABC transporter substrate-binding protein n=1 Tax=Nakamurella deserti TaxID=2164074 RepID=UPI000DBE8E74|nr:ABC transporter substrate-binding protein [Nakamurella deserti]